MSRAKHALRELRLCGYAALSGWVDRTLSRRVLVRDFVTNCVQTQGRAILAVVTLKTLYKVAREQGRTPGVLRLVSEGRRFILSDPRRPHNINLRTRVLAQPPRQASPNHLGSFVAAVQNPNALRG